MAEKIRLLIVDDSIFFREYMSRSLSADPKIEVVGAASDAYEAMAKIKTLKPQVLTLDIEMPKMRGTDFLRKLRPMYPNIQVVVISSVSGIVFEALQAGAVDFVSKPNSQVKMDNAGFIAETLQKIKIAATLSITKSMKAAPSPVPAPVAPARPAIVLPRLNLGSITFKNPNAVIAIGASTGGTEAILTVLKGFPANIPGTVIVQHMPPVFTGMYAERLNKTCAMKVREAKDGDRVEQGVVLIAPGGDAHMRVQKDARGCYVRLTTGEKVSGHCPSVDVLFESVAATVGRDAVGVILTGMGADGAKHLLTMRKAGAHTIGQDQESSVVYGMPMVAYNLGGVSEQLPIGNIADAVVRKLI